MRITLQLLPTNQPQRPATAWLVAGSSCEQWLKELTAWQIRLVDLRLFRLPTGLLVIPGPGESPNTSPTTLPYGALESNVFVPVEAALNAAVSTDELHELFPQEALCLWHPSAGLLVLTDELRLDDLLAAVPRREADWSRAMPGTALNGRMLSLGPTEPLHMEQVWREVRDDIGSEPPTLDKLPRSPTEPSSDPLSKLGRSMKGGLAKLIQWLNKPGASSGARGTGAGGGAILGAMGGMLGSALGSWGSGLANWASETLAKWSAALEEERHREVSRLLNMLQNDPDAGLKFAIPFSNEPGRGFALPGSRLMERSTNFSLRGGGGAIDPWNISNEYYAKLTLRYRELANREIALGRHRRAAYIFAHLLGDFSSAARTLADGGHYREAAVLYEERLAQPLEAARALEQGSLWSEAIAIYERLGHDEKAGDLYLQLDQPEQATTAYRREVVKSLRTDDRLAAARLLETKLAAVDEAVDVLVDGWPESNQAIRCVEATFQLLGRLGEHDRAARQVRLFAQGSGGRISLARQLVQSFAALATTYPSNNVRNSAADQTRLLAAEHLDNASGVDLAGLTDALRKLAPQDRLLLRDTQRFVQQFHRRQSTTQRVRKPTISLVRQIQLAVVGQWKTLIGCGNEFYAAGVHDRSYVVARGSWQSSVQLVSHSSWVKSTKEEWPLLLAAHERYGQVVFQPVFEKPLQGEAVFPATSNHPRVVVGSHPGLGGWESKEFVVAMDYTVCGTFDVAKFNDLSGETIWSSHALLSPNLLSTTRVNSERMNGILPPTLFHSGLLYVACGQQLGIFDTQKNYRGIELPSAVSRLSASRPWTRQRIVVSLADGGVILWGDSENAPFAKFGEGLGSPYTCITRGGLLVAAADGVIEVYDTRDTKLTHLAMKAEPSFRPCGLVATDQPQEFAMLMEDGTLLAFRLEGWQ